MAAPRRAPLLSLVARHRAPVVAFILLATPLCAALAAGTDIATATPTRAGKSAILYVGDSLGVGTLPELRSVMPRRSFDGNTRVGRSSVEGVSVLRAALRRRHTVVIFDVGSNDYRAATLAGNLNRARELIGDRLLIVLTMNKPSVRPFNRVVRRFAAVSANVVVVDWHARATEERLLARDGIHSGPSGYRRRAGLIARRISRASKVASSSVSLAPMTQATASILDCPPAPARPVSCPNPASDTVRGTCPRSRAVRARP